jgi:hypothetical protein
VKIKLKPEKLRKTRTIILLLLLALCLLPLLQILLFPSRRTGPFGIGLPSPMEQYSNQESGFSIVYPKSWVFNETPDGAHGDNEVIAVILVPGRSFPQVLIAHKSFPDKDLNQVAQWGQSRAKDKCECILNPLGKLETSNFRGIAQEYSWQVRTMISTTTIFCQDLYVLYNTDGYALSFCASQSYWPRVADVFNEMMNSFSIR